MQLAPRSLQNNNDLADGLVSNISTNITAPKQPLAFRITTEAQFRRFLDENIQIKTKTQALDFVRFIVSKNGAAKLGILDSLPSSQYGLKALEAAISLETSDVVDFARETVFPLIRFVGNDEIVTLGSARIEAALKLLRQIYNAPNVFEKLVEKALFEETKLMLLNDEEILHLGWLILQLMRNGEKISSDCRKCRQVVKLVQNLASSVFPGSKNVSRQISNLLFNLNAKFDFKLELIDSLRKNEAGWRHNNDKADFRSIAAYPTAEELTCLEPTFLPETAPIFEAAGGTLDVPRYLEWAFRLLRQDIVESIQEEVTLLLQKEPAFDKKLGGTTSRKMLDRLKNRTVHVVEFPNISCDHRLGIAFEMRFNEPAQLEKIKTKSEKVKYWERRRTFLKENSLLAFFRNESELVCLGYVNLRAMAKLTQEHSPPSVDVVVIGKQENRKIIAELGMPQDNLKAVQLSASFFAYQPLLERLQKVSRIPFEEEILRAAKSTEPPSYGSESTRVGKVVEYLEKLNLGADLAPALGLTKPLILDRSQKDAVTLSLKRRVALIQGPPGTGKSFCGAVISKIIHRFSYEKILCVCYTNHALDQFLEDLIDIGLPEGDIVRLGSAEKMSERISQFAISSLLAQRRRMNKVKSGFESGDGNDSSDYGTYNANSGKHRGDDRDLDKETRRKIWSLHRRMEEIENDIKILSFRISHLANQDKMADLLPVMPPDFVKAFKMPSIEGGFEIVGENGATLGSSYLWKRWAAGETDRGTIDEFYPETNGGIAAGGPWSLSAKERSELIKQWRERLIGDELDEVERLMAEFNALKTELREFYSNETRSLLCSKRIIGCTTLGAAKYAKELGSVGAGVLIIEEAGELLEPHVITSMASNCKHLIMIGDHKQLRPKRNVYKLSVESGSPYEFNRSLFERLVLNGFPHVTLQLQHRMRPEFSHLIRELTYPGLRDAEKVKGHQNLRGTPSNLIFIQHEHEEGGLSGDDKNVALSVEDCMSKVNWHEVGMVSKIVEYLLCQGYRSEEIVILTPYLGQFQAIRGAISKLKLEVALSERDVSDLNRFGLEDSPAAFQRLRNDKKKNSPKRPSSVRVATVDNYQGEESDIIIASLVRSNKEGIVGFIGEPERVNVLLSRARFGMILIGNMRTFENAKSSKTRQLWTKLLEMLKEKGAIFPGFPAFCSVHGKHFILAKSEDFEKLSPEGGCDSDCGKIMTCGRHQCPKKCHRVPADHSQIDCQVLVDTVCPGHNHPISNLPCHLAMDPKVVAERCKEPVAVTCPSRGHTLFVPCYLSFNLAKIAAMCEAMVEVQCRKRHPVTIQCSSSSDPDAVSRLCTAQVEVVCSENGHVTMVSCNVSYDQGAVDSSCQCLVLVRCPNCKHHQSVPCSESKTFAASPNNCKELVETTCANSFEVRSCESKIVPCPDCAEEAKSTRDKGNKKVAKTPGAVLAERNKAEDERKRSEELARRKRDEAQARRIEEERKRRDEQAKRLRLEDEKKLAMQIKLRQRGIYSSDNLNYEIRGNELRTEKHGNVYFDSAKNRVLTSIRPAVTAPMKWQNDAHPKNERGQRQVAQGSNNQHQILRIPPPQIFQPQARMVPPPPLVGHLPPYQHLHQLATQNGRYECLTVPKLTSSKAATAAVKTGALRQAGLPPERGYRQRLELFRTQIVHYHY